MNVSHMAKSENTSFPLNWCDLYCWSFSEICFGLSRL